jgi:hypothetical protein
VSHLKQPQVLYIDIETAPILAAVWGLFEQNAVWVERDTYIMSFAAKWNDGKKTKTYALPDYPLYKRDRHSDKALCKELHGMLSKADIVVAHNGDAFDVKKINSRLAVNGFNPPAPYKTVDTLKLARRVFKFDSNKLDNLGRYLGEGRKIPNTGAALWRGCVNGDPKSWATMRRYNAQDVDLLERVYHRLKGWSPNHPKMTAYTETPGCPTCGSDHVQRRGMAVKINTKRYRFQCQECAAWFFGDKV